MASAATSVVAEQSANGFKSWVLRHVARPQPAQEYVPQIDGLRFVAIMAVLLYHIQGYVAAKAAVAGEAAPGLVHQVLAVGSFGVPLFFAISGYILCRPFLGGRQVSLKRYFTRRLTRLEPPYLISMLLIFVMKLSALHVASPDLLPNLLASLSYSHNLFYGAHSAVNGVAWSLEIEWQFYLVAPLIFAAASRSRPLVQHAGLLLLIGVGGWVYAVAHDADPRFKLSILHYFGFFMAGVWVAVLDEDHGGVGRDSLWLDLLGAITWVAALAVLLDGRRYASLLPALTALMLLSGLRGRIHRRLLGWWPVYCVGAMCYTVYLYHFFIISAAGRVFAAVVGWPSSMGLALLAFGVVAVPAVLVACLVPYLLVERPFMVWRPGRNRLSDAFRRQG